MSLDACVYCDCVEKGNLRTPPPHLYLLRVDEDGAPYVDTDDLTVDMEFDQWQYARPCPHKDFWLVLHHLGNMSCINRIRWCVKQMSADPEADFPLLWTRVIYNGIHASDRLMPEEAVRLGVEIQRLKAGDWGPVAADHGNYLGRFLEMLAELVEASRFVNKPISF